MTAFHVIRDHLHQWDESRQRVALTADRLTLEKRRWRGVAADGVEFGFDLEHALANEDVFFVDATSYYQLEQRAERVISIPLRTALEAARLGWMIGNLHFKIGVTPASVQAPDDPAIRQMLEREKVTYEIVDAVFKPLSGGHAHGHH